MGSGSEPFSQLRITFPVRPLPSMNGSIQFEPYCSINPHFNNANDLRKLFATGCLIAWLLHSGSTPPARCRRAQSSHSLMRYFLLV
jgi:hypothetical protein